MNFCSLGCDPHHYHSSVSSLWSRAGSGCDQVVGDGRHEVGVLLLTDTSCPCTSFPGPLLPFPSLCPKCWDVQAHHDLSILCPVPNATQQGQIFSFAADRP